MNGTVLIVEDDLDLQIYLKEFLGNKDFLVDSVPDGKTALDAIEKQIPDLVMLDLDIPNLAGEITFFEIRKNYPNIKMILLLAKSTSFKIEKKLKLNSDDCLIKPLDTEKLLLIINIKLKINQDQPQTLQFADLVMDYSTLRVKRGDKFIKLTPQEFNLLEYLVKNQGTVLTREIILKNVWLNSKNLQTRIVDVYIGYLREKIDSQKKLIQTIRGVGYQSKISESIN